MTTTDDESLRSDRTRYLDVNKEPDAILPPLPLVEATTPILSLRESVRNLHSLITDLDEKVTYALSKCQHPEEGLCPDESAALYLYSLEWPKGQHSFYTLFNRALRSEDRTKFLPFHLYYNLFISALNRLPSIQDRVWRGVNGDISKQYRDGTIHVWWGVSSCTDAVHVTDTFLDKNQPRTLFNIKCYNGKSIQKHSEFPRESETILAPGTYIKVVSQSNPADNLHIVQCEQIEYATEEEIAESLIPASVTESVFYLIWSDPNVNKSKDNLSIQNNIRQLFGEAFLAYESVDQCETFVRDMKDDRVILITGGQVGRELVPKIHDLVQLKAIFIYCIDKEENDKWAKNYVKIKRVVVNPNELLEQLKEEKETYLIEALPKSPLNGYEQEPLLALEEAVQPLISIIPEVDSYAAIAKRNAMDPADGLTEDESASIILYTMEWTFSESAFHFAINQVLREGDPDAIRPFYAYLRLVLSALRKLPSFQGIVWRSVKLDLHREYVKGYQGVWWCFTTTTTEANVLQNDQFLGTTGTRTLLSIQCQNGKRIRNHSYFPAEDEIMLMPGFHFEVVSVLQTAKDMHLIQIQEIDPSS